MRSSRFVLSLVTALATWNSLDCFAFFFPSPLSFHRGATRAPCNLILMLIQFPSVGWRIQRERQAAEGESRKNYKRYNVLYNSHSRVSEHRSLSLSLFIVLDSFLFFLFVSLHSESNEKLRNRVALHIQSYDIIHSLHLSAPVSMEMKNRANLASAHPFSIISSLASLHLSFFSSSSLLHTCRCKHFWPDFSIRLENGWIVERCAYQPIHRGHSIAPEHRDDRKVHPSICPEDTNWETERELHKNFHDSLHSA